MQSADVKIMIFIDGDDSSLKAIRFGTRMALDHKAKGSTVAVVLVNLYSSWDVSGNEERDGRLMMDQAESFAESSGVRGMHFGPLHVFVFLCRSCPLLTVCFSFKMHITAN